MLYKVLFFVLALLFFPLSAGAEENLDERTDEYVREVPVRVQANIFSLTRYLTAPFDNDYDKARAIAYYIASHMVYDNYLYNENGRTRLKYRRQTPEEFLKSKVGICADFADLFQAMCKSAGISVDTVKGHVVDKSLRMREAEKNKILHAWSVFKYRNKKVYVDTTFMASAETGHERRVSEFRRRKAVNKIKKESRRHNTTYDIEPFYFDFTYEQEKKLGLSQHVER